MDGERQIPAASGEESAELASLLGTDRKREARRTRHIPEKKFWILLGGCAALLGLAGAAWAVFSPKEKSSTAPVYREYTVERGDVVVGQSESSSVSLQRETVTFPVSAEVVEVYVKAGSSVKAGDPLVRLDADDIAEGLKSYELQLEVAALELEQAKLQQQTRLLQAEQTLENSEQTSPPAHWTAKPAVKC